jgi:hypothetical protein
VIDRVIKVTAAGPFRPQIPDEGYGSDQMVVINKMKECWGEEPGHRPSFSSLRQFLRKLNSGR